MQSTQKHMSKNWLNGHILYLRVSFKKIKKHTIGGKKPYAFYQIYIHI